jgi:phosphate transport system substrate-binding protein
VKISRFVLAALVAAAFAAPAHARDQIRIVGSSTVFPFSTAVAESFGRAGGFKTPVVESTGTGGGIQLFCSGNGLDTPDIANASRRIKPGELDTCTKNGVKDVIEVKIGYDGIVLANSKKHARFDLTKEQIFRALAKQVPIDGKLTPNPYRLWSDVDPKLPKEKIEVLGPPPTSGTRDAFVELALEGGAEAFPMLKEMKAKDEKAFKAIAHAVREDGVYVEAGENDNLIVQKIETNPAALGVFGFSFLDQNTDKVQGSLVGGVEPTFENIAGGKYGISRSLFFYVKKSHIGQVPGLKEYMAEFTSDGAFGEEGYLADKGLIPLEATERKTVRAGALALQLVELK